MKIFSSIKTVSGKAPPQGDSYGYSYQDAVKKHNMVEAIETDNYGIFTSNKEEVISGWPGKNKDSKGNNYYSYLSKDGKLGITHKSTGIDQALIYNVSTGKVAARAKGSDFKIIKAKQKSKWTDLTGVESPFEINSFGAFTGISLSL